MNSRILMVWMLSSALLQSGSGYLQLESAPVEKAPTLLAQEGLSVFDLEVDRRGRVQDESLLLGQPPFVERSRLSMKDWSFAPNSHSPAHINATFLYRPQTTLPDSKLTFDIPLPGEYRRLQSPFAIQITVPGYPADALYGDTVVLQLGITATGSVAQIRVIQDAPGLTNATIAAVRYWKFYVPPKLQEFSRTAVVVVQFATPKLGIPASLQQKSDQAALVSGAGVAAQIGAEGTLLTDDPDYVIFSYGESHWTLPYPMIRQIECAETHDGYLLTIMFAGAGSTESVTFRLEEHAALSAASTISVRSSKAIQFFMMASPSATR